MAPFWSFAVMAPDPGLALPCCTKLTNNFPSYFMSLFSCASYSSSIQHPNQTWTHVLIILELPSCLFAVPCYAIINNVIDLISFRQEAKFQHIEIRSAGSGHRIVGVYPERSCGLSWLDDRTLGELGDLCSHIECWIIRIGSWGPGHLLTTEDEMVR